MTFCLSGKLCWKFFDMLIKYWRQFWNHLANLILIGIKIKIWFFFFFKLLPSAIDHLNLEKDLLLFDLHSGFFVAGLMRPFTFFSGPCSVWPTRTTWTCRNLYWLNLLDGFCTASSRFSLSSFYSTCLLQWSPTPFRKLRLEDPKWEQGLKNCGWMDSDPKLATLLR